MNLFTDWCIIFPSLCPSPVLDIGHTVWTGQSKTIVMGQPRSHPALQADHHLVITWKWTHWPCPHAGMNYCSQRDMAYRAERRIVVPSKNCVLLLENKGLDTVCPHSGPGTRPESYKGRPASVRGFLQGIARAWGSCASELGLGKLWPRMVKRGLLPRYQWRINKTGTSKAQGSNPLDNGPAFSLQAPVVLSVEGSTWKDSGTQKEEKTLRKPYVLSEIPGSFPKHGRQIEQDIEIQHETEHEKYIWIFHPTIIS